MKINNRDLTRQIYWSCAPLFLKIKRKKNETKNLQMKEIKIEFDFFFKRRKNRVKLY